MDENVGTLKLGITGAIMPSLFLRFVLILKCYVLENSG